MAYPHKWSPISYRSSAEQWKFAGERLTLYHCGTQPTTSHSYRLHSTENGSCLMSPILMYGWNSLSSVVSFFFVQESACMFCHIINRDHFRLFWWSQTTPWNGTVIWNRLIIPIFFNGTDAPLWMCVAVRMNWIQNAAVRLEMDKVQQQVRHFFTFLGDHL